MGIFGSFSHSKNDNSIICLGIYIKKTGTDLLQSFLLKNIGDFKNIRNYQKYRLTWRPIEEFEELTLTWIFVYDVADKILSCDLIYAVDVAMCKLSLRKVIITSI